jgi:plastocyanin
MEPSTVENSEQKSKQGNMMLGIPIALFVLLAIWFVSQNKPATTGNTMGAETTASAPTQAVAQAAAEEVLPIAVEGGHFYFKPNEIRVKVGQKVKVTLTSVGGMPHDFVIDELNVRTKQIKDGETDVVEFTPDKPGTYEFYCSVGKHRAMGMKGNLIVE